MIYETLQIIKEQLDNYLDGAGLGKMVIVDNVAMLESGSDGSSDLEAKVIITLLNIEEEVTLKNVSSVKVVNNKSVYSNPPVNLNLYFIASANCDSYDNSLMSISKTIKFFQGKSIYFGQYHLQLLKCFIGRNQLFQICNRTLHASFRGAKSYLGHIGRPTVTVGYVQSSTHSD